MRADKGEGFLVGLVGFSESESESESESWAHLHVKIGRHCAVAAA